MALLLLMCLWPEAEPALAEGPPGEFDRMAAGLLKALPNYSGRLGQLPEGAWIIPLRPGDGMAAGQMFAVYRLGEIGSAIFSGHRVAMARLVERTRDTGRLEMVETAKELPLFEGDWVLSWPQEVLVSVMAGSPDPGLPEPLLPWVCQEIGERIRASGWCRVVYLHEGDERIPHDSKYLLRISGQLVFGGSFTVQASLSRTGEAVLVRLETAVIPSEFLPISHPDSLAPFPLERELLHTQEEPLRAISAQPFTKNPERLRLAWVSGNRLYWIDFPQGANVNVPYAPPEPFADPFAKPSGSVSLPGEAAEIDGENASSRMLLTLAENPVVPGQSVVSVAAEINGRLQCWRRTLPDGSWRSAAEFLWPVAGLSSLTQVSSPAPAGPSGTYGTAAFPPLLNVAWPNQEKDTRVSTGGKGAAVWQACAGLLPPSSLGVFWTDPLGRAYLWKGTTPVQPFPASEWGDNFTVCLLNAQGTSGLLAGTSSAPLGTGDSLLLMTWPPEDRLTARWQSERFPGSFLSLASGDSDGDGREEIFAVLRTLGGSFQIWRFTWHSSLGTGW